MSFVLERTLFLSKWGETWLNSSDSGCVSLRQRMGGVQMFAKGGSQRMGEASGLWERRRATAAVVPSVPI